MVVSYRCSHSWPRARHNKQLGGGGALLPIDYVFSYFKFLIGLKIIVILSGVQLVRYRTK